MLFVFEVFRDCLGCLWRVWVVLESILFVFRVLCFSAVFIVCDSSVFEAFRDCLGCF